jgi:uncharacterized protein YodC (DUF2158 family)
MIRKNRTFPAAAIALVARGVDIPGTREQLHIGDCVRMNSGGPLMLVVAMEGESVTVAWSAAGKSVEATFHRLCLAFQPAYACGPAGRGA